MKQAIVCIVPSKLELETILLNLQAAGFRNSDISFLLPDQGQYRDLGYEKHSKAPEGISVGTATGAALGGAFGWLTGIGAIAIPGLGAFVAAGPIMAALSGAAVGTAIGGVTGGLIGLGLPEYEAKQYESKLRDGNMLFSVHCSDSESAKTAEKIVKEAGATDVMAATEEPVKAK